jgi:hypothetical protein
MARADYFDRALHAARHVLGSLDQDAFLNKVDNHRVGLAFDSDIENTEAFAAADLFIRLTARFYPELAIVALDTKARKPARALEALAKRINPKIGLFGSLNGVNDLVVVGRTWVAVTKQMKVLYVGSDGWIARLSSRAPLSFGTSMNPLGAGFSACLAAANVFRSLFSNAARDRDLTISLLDLDPQAPLHANPAIASLDVGEVFLVGAGAIGNGFLWALSRSGVKGQLAVVDHEQIDLSNLQRYVLSEREHVGAHKTTIAQDMFRDHPGISVHPVSHRWQDLMDVLTPAQWGQLKKVVVALDTPQDRIGVQASLPLWIVNGWTQGSEFGVSRHSFLGQQACMACLYMPRQKAPNLDELISQALGFPPEQLMRVRKLIETAQPLDQAILLEIATAKNLPLEKLLPFEGKPIHILYTQGVCSGQIFELANGPAVARAEVPMPFQSAAAGIFQLAALLGHVAGHAANPTISQVDLMRPFPSSHLFSRNEQKAGSRCLCADVDYQDAFREKHAISH